MAKEAKKMGENMNSAENEVSEEKRSAEEENTFPVTHIVDCSRGLNLRLGPGINWPVLCELPDGMELATVDIPSDVAVPDWRPVRTSDGLSGWVCAAYVMPACE